MTDKSWVLGDADVARLWREFLVTATLWPHNASNTPWDFARAVERAVLAKVPEAGRRPIYEMWAADARPEMVEKLEREGYCVVLLTTKPERDAARINGVTEREARKRERDAAAWMWGLKGGWNFPDLYTKLAERYPLPTKRVPRTVTLSDGSVAKVINGGIEIRREFGSNISVAWTPPNLPVRLPRLCDARLLADLVERPYDEVEDDTP